MSMNKRALLPWQKRDVVEKLLKVWIDNPHQRLGQLIDNAAYKSTLFNIEDYDLIDQLFAFDKKFNKDNEE